MFWLSRPGILTDIDEARRGLADGTTVSEDEVRAEFGVPRTSTR